MELDNELITGVDDNPTLTAEVERRGADPNDPATLKKLIRELGKERGEAEFRQFN